MIFCVHIAAVICLVIVQTVIITALPFFDFFYDLLIPFVIYLGLFRSLREGLPVVLLCGFLIDGLSGAGFGLYFTTYIWLYLLCRWVINFFHSENSFISLFAVVSGVILQNIMFLGIFFILEPGGYTYRYILRFLHVQIIFALITGPLFLVGFRQVFIMLDNYLNEIKNVDI